jgi:hypothetical protein
MGPNARQSNVELAMREDRGGEINTNFVKGTSLRFVDGHCEGWND